jgi:hypothetical protein
MSIEGVRVLQQVREAAAEGNRMGGEMGGEMGGKMGRGGKWVGSRMGA